MKKFKFVGDPETYGWDDKPVVGKIYDGTHKGYNVDDDFESSPIEEWPKNEGGQDWEEVTEQKPLHKDTDLGYFVIMYLQMQGVSKGNPDIVWAIRQAEKLINKLDHETNRH